MQVIYDNSGIGNAIGQGLSGLVGGFESGAMLAAKLRSAQAYQQQAETQARYQQQAEKQQRMERMVGLTQVPPATRKKLLSIPGFRDDLIGPDANPDTVEAINKLADDDEAFNALVAAARAYGGDPAIMAQMTPSQLVDYSMKMQGQQAAQQAAQQKAATEQAQWQAEQSLRQQDMMGRQAQADQRFALEQQRFDADQAQRDFARGLELGDLPYEAGKFEDGQTVYDPKGNAWLAQGGRLRRQSAGAGQLPLAEGMRERLPDGSVVEYDKGGKKHLTEPGSGSSRDVLPPDESGPVKLTEQQATARIRYNAAAHAFNGMQDIVGTDWEPSEANQFGQTVKEGAASLPWGIGALIGPAANAVISPMQNEQFKQFQAYQESLIQQIIRAETGAGGGESASVKEQIEKRYRITSSDTPETANMKLSALREYLDTMRQVAGPEKGLVPLGAPRQFSSKKPAPAAAASPSLAPAGD